MDTGHELRGFLVTHRAEITPQPAGLPAFDGGSRRAPGLPREEIAVPAGVSIDNYARLEPRAFEDCDRERPELIAGGVACHLYTAA